jgi:hypothetical protein
MISGDKAYPSRGKRAAVYARYHHTFAEVPRVIYTEDLTALARHLGNLGIDSGHPAASTAQMYGVFYCHDDSITRSSAPSGKDTMRNALRGAMFRHARTEVIAQRRRRGHRLSPGPMRLPLLRIVCRPPRSRMVSLLPSTHMRRQLPWLPIRSTVPRLNSGLPVSRQGLHLGRTLLRRLTETTAWTCLRWGLTTASIMGLRRATRWHDD